MKNILAISHSIVNVMHGLRWVVKLRVDQHTFWLHVSYLFVVLFRISHDSFLIIYSNKFFLGEIRMKWRIVPVFLTISQIKNHAIYLIAFLDIRKQFTLSPLTARIEPGSKLDIKCIPPLAQPEAQISWLKNNEDIPPNTSSVTITKEGSLIINSAKSQVRVTWSTWLPGFYLLIFIYGSIFFSFLFSIVGFCKLYMCCWEYSRTATVWPRLDYSTRR